MSTYAYLNTTLGLHSGSQQLKNIDSFLKLKQLHIDEIYAEECGENNTEQYVERNLVDLCCSLLPKDVLIVSNVIHITKSGIGELYDFIERYVRPYQIRFIICDVELDMDFTDKDVIIQHKMMYVLFKTEKQLIQERTKLALKRRKHKLAQDGSFVSKNGNVVTSLGRPKGSPVSQNAIKASVATRKAKAKANHIHFLREMRLWESRRGEIKTNADITAFAEELNAHEFKTATGLPFNYTRCRDTIKIIKSLFDEENSLTIIEKKTDAMEYPIDKSDLGINSQGLSMDLDKLQIHQLQTEEAQGLLTEIFTSEDDEIENPSASLILSQEYMNILKVLLTKEVWERRDIEELCKNRNIITGAMMEQINDYSFSVIEDSVIEDDGEYIYVNVDFKKCLI